MPIATWFFDFETFYTQEYSLRRMTPVEYILDPRFEAIGCAIKEGVGGNTYWVDGPDLTKFFADLPRDIIGVSHNWLFDGCVLAWRYNFIPRLSVCTLSVARALLAHKLRSLSLDSVSKYLGLPPKGNTVHKVIGLNLDMIKAAGIYDEYVEYSKRDDDNCASIFDILVRGAEPPNKDIPRPDKFPASEILIMDTVMRAAVQPRFRLDPELLHEHAGKLEQQKNELLARAMLVGADGKSDLMSNERFAELLRSIGVEPPVKISPQTGRVTYAFAKTDQGMIDLEEHEDPGVQALAAARLGHKSTIEESRVKRLISISQLQWPAFVTHPSNEQAILMPMPLRFSGAHTHRLSGDWKLNMQNNPRGSAIRRALTVRKGEKVLKRDASQIEARVNAWFCGQDDLVAQFARGEDVYSNFASHVFGCVVTKKDKPKRFVGKTCVLGLGYQTGWEKLRWTIKVKSREQLGEAMIISDEEAKRIVKTYRTVNYKQPAMWEFLLHTAIPVLAGIMDPIQIGPILVEKGSILLPNGLRLYFPNTRWEDGQWVYDYAGSTKKIYGGALLENIIQALARICTMDAAARIRRRIDKAAIWMNLQAHDELVYIVPDRLIEPVNGIMREEMDRRPWWAPDLPLASEGGVGPSYGQTEFIQ